MSMRNPRGARWPATGAGLAALAMGGLLSVAAVTPAAAQQGEGDCLQELRRIAAQMEDAELTRAQRSYVRDLLETGATFAANDNVHGCRQTVVDLAEYVQEESIDVPLAREARDWAPFVADTPENLRSEPQPEINVPDLGPPRVGETSAPLPVPPADANVTVERAEPEVRFEQEEPRVEVERAEPDVRLEQAEPNVTIEQAEPRVTIERVEGQGG